MPELPEVETIRRRLAPAIRGRRVVGASAFASPKFTEATAVTGGRIDGVQRRGKYLIVAVSSEHDGPLDLVVHLGMTGRLQVVGSSVVEPDHPHLRARWELDDGTTLAFHDARRFGRIAVTPRGEHTRIRTLAELGPEPLSTEFTPEGLHEALSRSRRSVKTQLLSQRPVAGVGNIYADEALWVASINPVRRRVGQERAARLHDALREVLAEGIRNGGTTLRDYVGADGRPGTNQHGLRCYGRAGSPCPRCSTALRSRVLDARTTTWCPRCQT